MSDIGSPLWIISASQIDVRFTQESDIKRDLTECL